MSNHDDGYLATLHAADTASCMSVSHLSVPCMLCRRAATFPGFLVFCTDLICHIIYDH